MDEWHYAKMVLITDEVYEIGKPCKLIDGQVVSGFRSVADGFAIFGDQGMQAEVPSWRISHMTSIQPDPWRWPENAWLRDSRLALGARVTELASEVASLRIKHGVLAEKVTPKKRHWWG